jgi:hypothetical protein
MNIALKEWAVVIEALARGRQRFLLRKGGIAEGRQGFAIEHREFLLYPTWEHQQISSIRPAFHALFDEVRPRRPGFVNFHYFARVTDILVAPPQLDAMGALENDHVWSPAYVEMRYGYRPDRPLFIVLARLYRLPTEGETPEIPRYAGCRSWVRLDEDIAASGAAAIEPDDTFEVARKSLLEKLLNQGARRER